MGAQFVDYWAPLSTRDATRTETARLAARSVMWSLQLLGPLVVAANTGSLAVSPHEIWSGFALTALATLAISLVSMRREPICLGAVDVWAKENPKRFARDRFSSQDPLSFSIGKWWIKRVERGHGAIRCHARIASSLLGAYSGRKTNASEFLQEEVHC